MMPNCRLALTVLLLLLLASCATSPLPPVKVKVPDHQINYLKEVKPLLDKPVGVHSRYCNMDLITERFGWRPKISLREGMTRVYNAAVERLKKEGKL